MHILLRKNDKFDVFNESRSMHLVPLKYAFEN